MLYRNIVRIKSNVCKSVFVSCGQCHATYTIGTTVVTGRMTIRGSKILLEGCPPTPVAMWIHPALWSYSSSSICTLALSLVTDGHT